MIYYIGSIMCVVSSRFSIIFYPPLVTFCTACYLEYISQEGECRTTNECVSYIVFVVCFGNGFNWVIAKLSRENGVWVHCMLDSWDGLGWDRCNGLVCQE